MPCNGSHIENLEMCFAVSIVLLVFGLLSLTPLPRAAGQSYFCQVVFTWGYSGDLVLDPHLEMRGTYINW